MPHNPCRVIISHAPLTTKSILFTDQHTLCGDLQRVNPRVEGLHTSVRYQRLCQQGVCTCRGPGRLIASLLFDVLPSVSGSRELLSRATTGMNSNHFQSTEFPRPFFTLLFFFSFLLLFVLFCFQIIFFRFLSVFILCCYLHTTCDPIRSEWYSFTSERTFKTGEDLPRYRHSY